MTSKKIYPGAACRLEFIVEDTDGLPVPSMTHSDVSSSAYRNRTNGVQSSATTATVTSSVASTAAVSAGQFVTIDSARGHYAIDVASGAAGATLDYAEAVVAFTAGHTVTPIQHEIDETLYTVNALNDISIIDVNGVLEAYRTYGVAAYEDTEIIKASIVQVNSVVDSIYLHTIEIGPAGSALTGIPWNPDWDTEIQSEVQDAIEVNHLDHLLAVEYDPASKPGVSTALLNELIGSDAGVSQFTANALELGPSGSGGGGTCPPPTVERSPADTKPITFSFPTSGATITGQVSKNNAAYAACTGAIAFLRTENSKHFYTLAYNAADRPSSEGTARYVFTDGTDTVYVNLRVEGVNGGDATLANQELILAELDAYITQALATVNGTTGTIVGFPDELTIGDSYTDAGNNDIHVFIRDENDDPILSVGDFEFTDPDFAPELIITNSGNVGRVVATVTYVDPGAGESYLKIELPSSQTRRAVPGVAKMQCVLKWDACQKTIATQSVTWVARL